MNGKKFFLKDLKDHRLKVKTNINILIKELKKRLKEHDKDKLKNKTIFSTYAKYCWKQRSLPYGSKEREKLENGEAMGIATTLHVKNNRHHFYDNRNEMTLGNVDLIDLIEVLSDWVGAMNREKLTNEEKEKRLKIVFEKYGIPDVLKKILFNTYKNYIE